MAIIISKTIGGTLYENMYCVLHPSAFVSTDPDKCEVLVCIFDNKESLAEGFGSILMKKVLVPGTDDFPIPFISIERLMPSRTLIEYIGNSIIENEEWFQGGTIEDTPLEWGGGPG